MIFRTLLLVGLCVFAFSASPVYASTSFVETQVINRYTDSIDGAEVSQVTGTSATNVDWLGIVYGTPGDITVCDTLAANGGYQVGAALWCAQEDVPNVYFNNCVYTCQSGSGSGSNIQTPGSLKTYLYTSAPTVQTFSVVGERGSGHDCGNDNVSGYCMLWNTTSYTPGSCAYITTDPSFWYNGGTQTLIWGETGENAANGGGINNNNFYFNQCKSDCELGGYSSCNYRFDNDLGTGAASQTQYRCYAVTGTPTLESKPITTAGSVETLYTAITVPSSCLVTGGINLTAGGVTPTTATTGSAVNLSATVTNNGTLATSAGFTNLFQIDADTDHVTVTTTKTDTSPVLNVSGTDTTTVSHTFGAAGTWYVRVCADNNASMVGAISETIEGDNCGPWTAVTVTTGGGGVTSCSASPTSISAGGSTTWTALPAGLASYTFTPSETGTGVVRATNTYARTYSTAGNYGMSVTAGGATVACSNTVTVGAPSCGTATPTITAVPDRVTSGGTSVITVSATGVDGTCTVTGPGVNQTITATSCAVPSTNITTGALSGQSTFTISCDSGETTAKAVVNVTTNWSIF